MDRKLRGESVSTEGVIGRRAWLVIGLSLIVAVFASSPASASVNFTKQWVGGSEFLSGQYVATSPSGDLYVSDASNNRVLKLDPEGALIGQLGTGGPGAGNPGEYNVPEGIATDSSGNVYVAEGFGDRVQKFDSSGNFVLMWGKGVNLTTPGDICTAESGDTCQGGSNGVQGGQFNFANGISVDSAGNVYVVDTNNRRVQKFDSSGVFQRAWGFGVATGANSFENCTVAATCHQGISGSGNGQFNGTQDVTTDSSNNVYVSDSGNDRIEKFDSSGTPLTTWGTSGSAGGQFNLVAGLATNSFDQILAVDFGNNDVQTFSSGGTFISSWGKGVDESVPGDFCTAFSGHTCGSGIPGSADGQFQGPNDAAVDSSGNIWVADPGNTRVQKFAAPASFTKKAGTSGSGGLYNAGSFGIDVATDADGNVYTSDHDTQRIQQFDPVGASTNAWGTSGTGAGQFQGPSGTAVDSSGNVYVADLEGNRVEKFDSAGNFVLMWGKGVDQTNPGDVCIAASGDTCQAGSSGSANGQFDSPNGVATDSSGNVYVADLGNDRIQRFSPSGVFLGKWGSHGTGNGQFDMPEDVAVDSAGDVYVADLVNNRVQRFSSTGTFLGKWGTAGSGPGQFEQPVAVATDSQRNVYVVDVVNQRVQVFRPSGVFIKQWDGASAGGGALNGPTSIAVGVAGTIYVADAGNNRVEMFSENDATAPQTTIASGPSGTTTDPTPTFSFSSTQPAGGHFECRIDGSTDDGFKPCGATKTLFHLGDGSHTLAVRAIDSAGNVDSTPATRTFTVKTAAVARSGSSLVVTAAAAAKDNIRITRPSASIIRVTDAPSGMYTGSGVKTGVGCTRVGDYRADCNAAGVTLVKVAAGGSTDRVVNSTALPSALSGGPANDILLGGTRDDTITGDGGADTMKGMNGNDRLLAHDLTNDASINCDGGTHPGTADTANLDRLPKDSAVSGCETKTRH
jgi:tripartite motif-containing protein 71